MLLLTSTSDAIEVQTSSTSALDVHATWVDRDSTGATITPGRENTAIITATTTEVVPSPGSGVSRNLQTLLLRNKGGATNVVDVTHTDGTTAVEVVSLTLAAGYSAAFVDGRGWALFNAAGAQVLTGISGGSSSPLTTKGDIWGFSTVDNRLPVGTNGQVVTADSAEPLGVKWATPSSGVTDLGASADASTVTVTSSTGTDATLTAATGSVAGVMTAADKLLVHGPTAGRHAIPVMAGAMRPSLVSGCASLFTIVSASNQPDIQTLDFDATTQEYAQFSIPMPKAWGQGTVTFKPIWSHASTATNFGVVWELQAVAVSDDDAIAAAYGTAQSSTDTGGTTDDLYIGPESSAITVGGAPAEEDIVFFRLTRNTGSGSDTITIDARLHGIILYITTDAENDA